MTRPDLLQTIGLTHLGPELELLDSIPSTMDRAWERAIAGADPGLVVVAAEQTGGRGRFGRQWNSPRGGLWLSALLSDTSSVPATYLPIAGALAVARAAERLGSPPVRLRWPNDAMIGPKKVAGVIAEARTLPGQVARRVVGVGWNVDVGPEAFRDDLAGRATSISIETGTPQDLSRALEALLVELDRLLIDLGAGGTESVEQEWKDRSSTLGEKVALQTPNGLRRGRVIDLSLAGGLTLESDDGTHTTYPGEGCSLRLE